MAARTAQQRRFAALARRFHGRIPKGTHVSGGGGRRRGHRGTGRRHATSLRRTERRARRRFRREFKEYRRYSMARRRRRHSRGMKIPIVSLAILGGQVAIAWQRGGGNALRTMQEIGVMYTGFDSNAGGWNVPRLVEGYGPWLVKWGIGKFGLLRSANAGIARMHVPVSLS